MKRIRAHNDRPMQPRDEQRDQQNENAERAFRSGLAAELAGLYRTRAVIMGEILSHEERRREWQKTITPENAIGSHGFGEQLDELAESLRTALAWQERSITALRFAFRSAVLAAPNEQEATFDDDERDDWFENFDPAAPPAPEAPPLVPFAGTREEVAAATRALVKHEIENARPRRRNPCVLDCPTCVHRLADETCGANFRPIVAADGGIRCQNHVPRIEGTPAQQELPPAACFECNGFVPSSESATHRHECSEGHSFVYPCPDFEPLQSSKECGPCLRARENGGGCTLSEPSDTCDYYPRSHMDRENAQAEAARKRGESVTP